MIDVALWLIVITACPHPDMQAGDSNGCYTAAHSAGAVPREQAEAAAKVLMDEAVKNGRSVTIKIEQYHPQEVK